MITLTFNTRELNRSMDELRKLTGIEDGKIIRNTAKFLVRTFVFRTRLMRRIKQEDFQWKEPYVEAASKGRARLGWWAAWKHLGIAGSPQIGNGPLRDRGEGGIVDKSRAIRDPHITVWNEVPYIEALNEGGKILEQGVARQVGFLNKALDRAYNKILKRKSG